MGVENAILAHLRDGAALSLDAVALALIAGAFRDLEQRMLPGEEAGLAGRVRGAIMQGARDPKSIAVEALQAEGWPARFEVRGELGFVAIRAPAVRSEA